MASAQRCMNRWIFPKIARARKREKERERESDIPKPTKIYSFYFGHSHMVQLLLPCPWRTRTAEPRSSVLAAPGKFIADDVESMVEDRSHCADTDCESIVWHADHHLQAALFQQYNTVINRDAWLKLEVPAASCDIPAVCLQSG